MCSTLYSNNFGLVISLLQVRVVDMYLVEGPKVLYRLALSALKVYSKHGAVSDDIPLSSAVSILLCTLSEEEKSVWFRDAFAVSLPSWSKLVITWSSQLPTVSEHDGPLPVYQRKVLADTKSEVLTEQDWPLIWSWLPEWVTTENPQCVFRSSRDGYK